ncbi:MAG: 2-polyprenyl-3-methyl-6-methoxy-1,4-benzoquinone monooxygenase [Gammaproteobacteria bacterium]|nr:2-polyprenyl-3-methyl-6-methoxy-1,4-benzoquinone monooxygenase [Gammaproteobacteria bacterium]
MTALAGTDKPGDKSDRAMTDNERSIGDQLLAELGHCLRVCAGEPAPSADNPAGDAEDGIESSQDREHSAGLMRVNHSGEVSAQALYRGQALVARDPGLRRNLLSAADEEGRHLKWCEERITELNGRRSLLTPFWYAGSFGIGALAGLMGDRSSLGFLAETEAQVESHLEGHLNELPADDVRSRRILEQMRADEARHGRDAEEAGGEPLPEVARSAMRLVSSVMTTTARYI